MVTLQLRIVKDGVEINGRHFKLLCQTQRRDSSWPSFDPRKFQRIMRAEGYPVPRGLGDVGDTWTVQRELDVYCVRSKAIRVDGGVFMVCDDLWLEHGELPPDHGPFVHERVVYPMEMWADLHAPAEAPR
jgi:hypothetical protein